MTQPYREPSEDLRAVKLHEDAQTERVRIETAAVTAREKIKEREATRRARGDGWLFPWLAVPLSLVLMSLIAYFAYDAKLNAAAPPKPPKPCHDEVFLAKEYRNECSSSQARGRLEGRSYVCTCPEHEAAPAPSHQP